VRGGRLRGGRLGLGDVAEILQLRCREERMDFLLCHFCINEMRVGVEEGASVAKP